MIEPSNRRMTQQNRPWRVCKHQQWHWRAHRQPQNAPDLILHIARTRRTTQQNRPWRIHKHQQWHWRAHRQPQNAPDLILHIARTHKTLTSGISWRVWILETARIRVTALMMMSPMMGNVQPTIIINVYDDSTQFATSFG